ncbi:helix-turn-helix transcriptional regulator [Methylopila sp. M107]|uniref:helix-turn-helix transcriptional regulator n=1 Tax=Methylopila sp. M107 TaxID=1101190 RepID=UPI0009DBEA5F|nr:helix-turn-helix transcriptional regulator [Methylopila sp. M107]
MNRPFTVTGYAQLSSGPGFATPIFSTRKSNNSFVQQTRKDGTIAQFIPIDDKLDPQIKNLNSTMMRKPGDMAALAYKTVNGSLIVRTKGAMRNLLIKEFDILDDYPHLKRTISFVVGDKFIREKAEFDLHIWRTERDRRFITDVGLSRREIECLKWMRDGKTNWEIGHILGISENTVQFHTRNLMRKLGVNSRLAAVINALKLGAIDL